MFGSVWQKDKKARTTVELYPHLEGRKANDELPYERNTRKWEREKPIAKRLTPCQRRNFRRRKKVIVEKAEHLNIEKEGWGKPLPLPNSSKDSRKTREKNSSHRAVVLLVQRKKALGQGEFPLQTLTFFATIILLWWQWKV